MTKILKEKLIKAIYDQANYQQKREIISMWKAQIIASRVIDELKKITLEEIGIFSEKEEE